MPTEPSSTAERERDRKRAARLLKHQAPPDWEKRFRKTGLLDSVIDGEPIQMFVMAADIRESTTLMKEAVRFERFALVMDKFVTSVRRGIRRSGGWFDKFTGDGFLAYWIVQSAPPVEYEKGFVQTAGDLVHTANELVDLFHRRVLEDFRANTHNLSAGVGLSMGLDAGPGEEAGHGLDREVGGTHAPELLARDREGDRGVRTCARRVRRDDRRAGPVPRRVEHHSALPSGLAERIRDGVGPPLGHDAREP